MEAARWLRYYSICKEFHMLPRSGGVLDQPWPEVLKLEQMVNAAQKYNEREKKRLDTQGRNRAKHSTTQTPRHSR